MDEGVTFGSGAYLGLLGVLVFSRGMDFLSTWIATPNLVLEANPLARRLGWKRALVVNGLMCLLFAHWALPTVIIATTSVLVAARNFQLAWLMRSAGEEVYQSWMMQRLAETTPGLFVFCVLAQSVLVGLVGGVLVASSPEQLVPLGIGTGIIAYAVALSVFSLLAVWRRLRAS